MRICVLGGGVIGVTTAYFLARDGHQVTLIERHADVAQETSHANGGQLSYNYVAPLADPSVLPKLPQWLFSRDAALRFVPRLDPRQWHWCAAFLLACTRARSRATTAELLGLGFLSQRLMHEIVARETIEFDYVRNGKLVVFRDQDGFEGARRQADYQAQLGCEQYALDGAACVALEPALAHIGGEIAGGIHTPGEEAGDCDSFTRGLARAAQRDGVDLRVATEFYGLRTKGRQVEAAMTSAGAIEADAFVVCLGMQSQPLLNSLGVRVPMYPLKGYSLTLSGANAQGAPRLSVTDAHYKVVYAPLGERLRIAGMVDLTGMSAHADQARIALLTRQARETFPDAGDYTAAQTWTGMRPATPDSKPLIGATHFRNLWMNTGHGALGFTLACGSAQLLADLLAQRALLVDGDAFAPAR
ncbi:D-amino acid dehydrogenase small subunit [Paraburkholderia eburnea]|uniref:D-amino acid dehydrogenase small subunit n=1 Tax=Paraburkholderia eburnea TaxID=1189126 RepID=A0A2S4M8Q1_9BURK|nr:D-amino acid dehydrogenase [Paraburkholderia eburnea]POR51133.1 D-amino acid dehydrogenase small subunit [Paraburkholderia eburnea]PRZ21867.1 D-amino acid dehydrogenase small subunit [Paraburkholderia eburnea]